MQGGEAEAQTLFEQLTQGGKLVEGTTYPGQMFNLLGGGQIGLRPISTSGPITIDVFIEGLGIDKIKFIP
jgi:hypothetical protein